VLPARTAEALSSYTFFLRLTVFKRLITDVGLSEGAGRPEKIAACFEGCIIQGAKLQKELVGKGR
jgi:hypothetical protein